MNSNISNLFFIVSKIFFVLVLLSSKFVNADETVTTTNITINITTKDANKNSTEKQAAKKSKSDISSDASAHASAHASSPKWVLVVAPTLGWLRNTASFPIPVGKDANDALIYEQRQMTDDGFGGGVTIMGFYKYVSFASVLFGFPNINHAKLLGSVNHVSLSIPTKTVVEPYFAMGLALVNTNADFYNYKETQTSELGGMTLKGFAYMSHISVDNNVIAPYPKVGLKTKIPIQHWYVTPFYSLMYEKVKTHTKSQGGSVTLYNLEGPQSYEQGGTPYDVVQIRAFDNTKEKDYVSHLVGADFFVDFHYFIQMRGKVYYNVNYNLWTVRLIGSMMLSKHMGITAYLEYAQKVTVTNTYFLIGPSFLFTPSGFMDKIMAKRNDSKKQKERKSE